MHDKKFPIMITISPNPAGASAFSLRVSTETLREPAKTRGGDSATSAVSVQLSGNNAMDSHGDIS